MTLNKRLHAGLLSLICTAAIATAASADEATRALTSDDADRYVAAFQDVERGDFIDAQVHAAEIKDKSLLGYLSFRQLMHPTAHKAAFDELSGWLAKFRDLPVADRIFALAAKRKPADAADPPAPVLSLANDPMKTGPVVSEAAQKARDAYFAGDLARVLQIAPPAGERFIAGLAAYRLRAFAQAESFFALLARDETQDPWNRAAGAYWASRAADQLGEAEKGRTFLRAAAQSPETFYGMIAERRLRIVSNAPPPPPSIDSLIQASWRLPAPEVAAFVRENSRAHRAAALAQIGRLQECGQELRAGLALARSPDERARWEKLAVTLGVESDTPAAAGAARRIHASLDYPTPDLQPRAGFTLDRALVYAIVRQESAFNPDVVSPKGAVGLMQLMPESAARVAGDDKLKADSSPLFEPSFNLRVGQDYLTWLMQTGMGYDLLKVVAAYNGGPGMVLKTAQALGGAADDDLLLIESLPAFETRAYVQKVMAGYWTYRQIFGEATRSLDGLAADGRQADVRLDLTETRSVTADRPAQALQIGMR